jgi:hypothetical protein
LFSDRFPVVTLLLQFLVELKLECLEIKLKEAIWKVLLKLQQQKLYFNFKIFTTYELDNLLKKGFSFQIKVLRLQKYYATKYFTVLGKKGFLNHLNLCRFLRIINDILRRVAVGSNQCGHLRLLNLNLDFVLGYTKWSLLTNQEQKYKTNFENILTGPCGESRVLKLKHLFLFSL